MDHVIELAMYVANDDSFVYNPLTDQYGFVTETWAINCLNKMMFLKNISDEISLSPTTPINNQFIKYTFLNFYEYYCDPFLFNNLIERQQSFNTDKLCRELTVLSFRP